MAAHTASVPLQSSIAPASTWLHPAGPDKPSEASDKAPGDAVERLVNPPFRWTFECGVPTVGRSWLRLAVDAFGGCYSLTLGVGGGREH
jgi:hypothetical protein